MKAKINYRSKKTIIIISVAVVLLIAAIVGTVAFVKGNQDAAAAMTDDGTSTSQNDGANAGLPNNGDQNNGDDQNNNGTTLPEVGDNTNPADSNNNGNNGSTTNGGTTGTNGANGSNTGANAGTTTGTTTTGNNGANVPNQDYTQTTVIPGRDNVLVEQNTEIGWSPISVAAYTAASKLKVHKPDLDLQKYAYLDGDSLEELPVNTAAQKGETITYVIKITNKGNEDVNGIRTIDVIPEGTELYSISEGGKPNNDGKIVWKNDIKAGKTVTVSFKVIVTADSVNLIKNTAKVNGEETPETKTPVITANKTAQVVTIVDKEEVLENRDAKVGETIRYTITAKNTTEVDGTTVIKDSIPDGTSFVDGTITEKGNFDKENGTITWNNVVVPAKGEVSVSFDVVVNEKTTAGEVVKSISNTATIGNTPTEEVETKVANITTVKTSEGKHSDGTLATDENPLHELDEITYTLTAKNDGEGKGTVKISDTIPTGTTLVGSIELDGKSYTEAELNAGIDVTLKAGEEKSITFTVKINPFEDERITVRNADAKQDETPVPPTDDKVVKEYVTVTVTKKWNEDNDKQTQKRPSYIRFELYAENKIDLIGSHDMDTSKNAPYTFAKQPKYNSDGDVINYTVQEKAINENDLKFYNSTFEVDKDGNGNKTFNFTNTFVVPDDKNPIEVTKVWDDNNDAAGKRTTAKAELVLKGDNKEYSHLMTEDNKTSVNNTYKYTFSELPKYDAKGDKITYVLSEKNTGSIFYTLENAKIDQDTMTVTNKFVVPDEKNPIEVTKVWDDNNDAAGKRSTAKAELVLKGDNKEYSHLMTEDNKTSVNNTYKYTFSELPKYDAKGDEITYVLSEKDTGSKFYTLENATINQNTMTVTNKFVVPDEKNPIEVTKVWDDNNDAAGKRSTAKAELVLKGDNKEYSHLMTEDNKTSVNNTYKYTFSELPKYDAKGDKITYVLSEKNTGSIFYTIANATIDQDTMTVTNKFVVPDEKNSITVTKIWDDNGNAPINGEDKKGPRPDTINIVFKGGKEDIDKKLTGTGNTWSESYSLPKYNENGNPITYTIDEKSTSLDWYVKSIDQEKYTITNSIPDLEITKKIVSLNGVKLHDNTEVSVVEGDVIGYEITVENIGNVDLTNVTVVDEMTNGNAIYENYDKTTNTVSNKIKDGIVAVIPELKTKSEPVSYLVYYKVTSTDVSDSSKSIDNTATATVKYTDVTGKEKEIDRFDEASAQVQDISKIEVEKTQSVNGKKLDKDEKKTKVTPGTVINYTIKVRNAGNTKQENVKVTDTMNKLSNEPYTIESVTVKGTARDYTNSEDGIVIGNLEIGEEAVITISYTVDKNDMTTTVGEIKNTVTVNKTNPDGTTPTDEVKVPTEEWKADIDVVKSSKLYRDGKEISGPAMYGDTIRYTIKATNTGNKEGTVKIYDTVPSGTKLIRTVGTTNLSKTELDALESKTGLSKNLKVEGKKGTTNGTASIYFEVKVTAKAGTNIKNTATIDDKEEKSDKGYDVENEVFMNAKTTSMAEKNITIVLDLSSSMGFGKWVYEQGSRMPNLVTRLDEAKSAITTFITDIYKKTENKNVKINLVTFNYKDKEEAGQYYKKDFDSVIGTKLYAKIDSNNYEAKIKEINSIKLPNGSNGGLGTNISAGLNKASELTSGKKENNIVILLGDGDPTKGIDSKKNAGATASELKKKATLYTISFGSGETADPEFMESIATDEDHAFTSADADGLSKNFDVIYNSEKDQYNDEKVLSVKGKVKLLIPTGMQLDIEKGIVIEVNGVKKSAITSLPNDVISTDEDENIIWDISGYDENATLRIYYYLK